MEKTASCSKFPPIPTQQIYRPDGKRFCRKELSSLNYQRLAALREELEARVDVANSDLVALLLKRDQLHMENDAIRMEIEDIVEFNRTKRPDIPPVISQQKYKQKCK